MKKKEHIRSSGATQPQQQQHTTAAREKPGLQRPSEDALSEGQPLDSETRSRMESRFGHSFGDVRVHADERAAQSARALSASAYTSGRDVVFGSGQYRPQSTAGRKLLAHELAHVVQQRASANEPSGERPALGDERDAFEQSADRAADNIARGSNESGSLVVQQHLGMQRPAPLIQRQKAGDASQAQESSTTQPAAAAPSVLTQTADRMIDSFDVDRKEGKRKWNLNKLTKEIVEALQASPRAYVRIFGVVNPKDDDPRQNAFDRANMVRKALIGWIGPNKFSEQRYDVAFSTGDETEPQVQVWISYNSLVVSSGQTASGPPPPATPAKQVAPAPAKETEKNIIEKLGEGTNVKIRGQTVNISIQGLKTSLVKKGDLKVDATVGLTGTIGLETSYGNWNFTAEVSPASGEWEISLTYPSDSSPPDLARIELIMKRGREAVEKIAEGVADPTTINEIKKLDTDKLKKKFSPYTDPVKNAIMAGKAMTEAPKPGVNLGIVAGSGTGPGGPILPADAPAGVSVRAVLIIKF